MEPKILVAYATWTGHTEDVAEAVAETLRKGGVEVDVFNVKDVRDVSAYGAAIVGGAIRAGRLNSDVVKFLEKNEPQLSRIPVAYFVVCLTMREDTEEHRCEVDGYLDAVRAKVPTIQPVDVGLFAGGLDPEKLSLPLRLVIKAMKAPSGDFRDWDAIRSWATGLRSPLLGS